jgi:hypothetical protein
VVRYDCSSDVGIKSIVRENTDPFYCYGNPDDTISSDYANSSEAKEPFGAGAEQFVFKGWNGTDTLAERSAPLTYERLAKPVRRFPSPAFSVVLPNSDEAKARRLIAMLIRDKYVDLHTKAVFVDINVFNVRFCTRLLSLV